MSLQPTQLTVLTTSQCTARCAHCSMNSGPERRDRLTFEQIRRAIDALHERSPLKVVIFAGGEPTLLGDHLLDAIAHAADRGIVTRMVTNAYWALSVKSARRKLVELREAGLAELNISADDYHLPYIPFERVEHAWYASKGLGFAAVVIANAYGARSQITPEFIQQRLGESLPLRYNEKGESIPMGETAADGTYYGLSNAYVQRLERAHETLSEADLLYPDDPRELEGGCPWAVRSLALSARNHLVACCGIEAEGNPVLDFGEAREGAHQQVLRRGADDVLVNAIALLGPMRMMRFVTQRTNAITFRPRYASVCEICEDIVTRPEVVAFLDAHAHQLADEIALLRQLTNLPTHRMEQGRGTSPVKPSGACTA